MTPILNVELSDDMAQPRLPRAVAARLTFLLDQQDSGQDLTMPEQEEAEGLVDMAELPTLLRVR
jgi:hypothetical protein